MEKYQFESHNLSGKNIPIIFHIDVINPKKIVLTHWHPNIEILCFLSGSGSVIMDNEVIEASPGDIIVINPNVLHTVKAKNETLTYYCLIADSDFCHENGINYSELEYKTKIQSSLLNEMYMNIVTEIKSDNSFKSAGIKAELLRFMVYLTRNYSSPQDMSSVKYNSNECIRLAIGYIHAHINNKLSLDSVADEIGLSKFYFSREFKKTTGLTVVEYINTMRCRNAKKLLQKNEYTIHEIALKCGFENDSYFTKTFKKYTGQLPSYYTKAI